jgi:hypothetical protein
VGRMADGRMNRELRAGAAACRFQTTFSAALAAAAAAAAACAIKFLPHVV